MAALFFPNPAALRLALANGLVPAEIALAPAAAGFDPQGRIWLEVAPLLPRESLAALHRLGVQVLGKVGVATESVRCWADLLPLVPSAAGPPSERTLFVVPDRALARFTARLRRGSREPSGIRLLDGPDPCGLVATNQPPTALLSETVEPVSSIESFTEARQGVWVRHGWEHPLPDRLVVPPGHFLLLRPPHRVTAVAGPVPAPAYDEFVLAARLSRQAARSAGARIPVQLHLVPYRQPEKESLWVLNAAEVERFWTFCAGIDERLTRRLETAVVVRGGESRLVVRTTGKRPLIVLPFAVTGFSPDLRMTGLFLPAGFRLQPLLRPAELARLFHLSPDRLVWLEPAANGGVLPHAVPLSAFRPVARCLEYTANPASPLTVSPRAEPFALAKWPVVAGEEPHDSGSRASPLPWQTPGIREFEETEPAPAPQAGWLRRSLRHLATRFSRRREAGLPSPPAADAAQPAPGTTGRRVERKLASPETLLRGHDWTARRRELEAKLLCELPRLGPSGRGPRWADLADVYVATGNAADAAVCWMNAAWESSVPALPWLEQWLSAECRAAKLTDQSGGLERWLSEPARPGLARVIAAYTAWAGFSPAPPAEFPGALSRILAYLVQHFDDLPVRAAWLARLGATRLCEGDVLGLARWRDRVLTRLAERGPGLDLDEPSFLRFHGTASADRFQTAREWLVRVRDPVVAWVQRQGDGGRLRSPGLDAETDATAAYAQFMLAWGLGCLGERTLARDWAARARKKLARAGGPAIDPAGHAMLGDLFLHRVKDAQEGRPAKLGLPATLRARLDALPWFTRYAVDRLRQHSRILEPLDRVRADRGLKLKAFWGNDPLAERLYLLTEATDQANVADEADALLRLCADSPGTTTIPRVVLTLLEVAPWLDPTELVRVLDLLPTAIDWVEAWLANRRRSDTGGSERVADYQAQMIEAACATAGALPPGLVSPALSQLVRRLLAAGPEIRRPLRTVSAAVFRCLRRLKLTSEADALIQSLDPTELAGDMSRPSVERLGLAIGWFVSGNEDAGNRILNEARESLFLAEDFNKRNRTELAIAYAETLGFAPPRIAHGRLEELFQRPFEFWLMGSTNRYFTLKPLQLIDTVVRSVVTDDFTLGPAVRGWLDDDEYLIRCRIHRDLAEILRGEGMA